MTPYGPTFTIEWDAECDRDGCTATARWCQNPSGTGVHPPVIYCPTHNPRPSVVPA